LLSEEVAMVVVPGTEGNFGVLPGHALLISTVRPGIIDVYGSDQRAVTQRLFVSGGFAEVSPERCTVLADEAMPVKDIDRAAVEGVAKALEGEVAGLKDEVARAAAEEKSELLARLRASERRLAASRAKLEALKALPH
jgi:F-type H+-transporting ATPase subunit epsilon